MQGKNFIFAIQSEDYKSWSIDVNDNIILSGQTYFLQYAPSGWQDIVIQNARNKTYWGIDRQVSLPLNFVKDGARILKHIFYTLGTETKTYLVIASQRLDYNHGVDYGFWYKKTIRSEIDFSSFQHTGSQVTVSCLEDGIAKYLKANENTEYEFLFDARSVNVKMDGIRLHDKANFEILSGDANNPVNVDKTTYGEEWYCGITYTSSDGDNFAVSAISSVYEELTGTWSDMLGSDNCILQNFGNQTITLTVAGRIGFTCTKMISSPAYSLWLRFLTSYQNITDQNNYRVVNTGAMTVNDTFDYDISININLQPGEKLFFQGFFSGGPGTDVGIRFNENSTFSISFITRRETTFIKAFDGQTLFNMLIEKVTEGKYRAAQSLFLNEQKKILFTSGNAIRELDDATIKIKFIDFFKWWNTWTDVALIEDGDEVDIKYKEKSIDITDPVSLPVLTYNSLKVSFMSDYAFNELNIGYPEIKSDIGALNGNDEFNTKFIFSIGTTTHPAVLDKVSPFSASGYEIEKIRTTKLDSETSDYKSDNEVFLLDVEDDAIAADGDIPEHYQLDRSLNATATGLTEPQTVFNIGLSPKRMLLNNGAYIRSALYLSDDKTLQFINADKNNKLTAGGISEKADINVGNLNPRYFYPVKLTFDVSADVDIEDILSLTPRKLLMFEFNGNVYSGVIDKTSVMPATRQTQTFELIAYVNTDLSSLIDYNG